MLRLLLLEAVTLIALPFLLLIARLRSRHPRTERRMLIIQLGKIGDMVCTTPLFRAIHDADPSLHVTVMCLSAPAEIIAGNPCLDGILALHEDRFSGFRGRLRLCRRLLRDHYDISVAVLPGTFNAMLGLWSCAPRRLHVRGGRIGPMGKFFHAFHTDRLTYARGTRTYDHYMKIASALGYPPAPYRHEVHLNDDEKNQASTWLREHSLHEQRFAVLSLTAGNVLKEWPPERFVEVARKLIEQHQLSIIFSSSDTARTMQAMQMLGHPKATDAGGMPLRMLSGVIANASLFISVDTGPLYIAHALGVPLIDIIGPVDPSEQPPPSGEKVALVLPPSIAPSSFVAETLRISNEAQRRALEETTVDMVIAGAEKILKI